MGSRVALVRTSRLLVPALVAALLLVAAPAPAAERLGPVRTVVAPPCASTASGSGGSADAAYGGGRIRGFASFISGPCNDQVWYAEGGSQGWTRVRTPYRGVVLAVAADQTATYLLYLLSAEAAPTQVAITKRTHDGRFWPTRVLLAEPQAVVPTGDVAARDGRWWAVWSQQVGEGGEFAQQQLFSAKTWGTPTGPTRLTTTPAAVHDAEPTIALDAQGAVLAWSRQDRPAMPGPADLWVAVSRDGALERARAFSSQGEQNGAPDVQRITGVTFLAWVRDGRVVAADNSTGRFRSHVFLVPGDRPRTGATSGSVYVAWTADTHTDASSRAYYARGNKGSMSFEGQYASAFGTELTGLVAVNGAPTLLVRSRRQVHSVTANR